MKKLISLVLSLALVACMFGMSVMAANVVGSHGNNSIEDGWSDTKFNSTVEYPQNIKLDTAGTYSRYAVDIVIAGTMTFGTGVWVWDVNALKYVPVSGTTTITEAQTYKCTVSNYSDKPVDLKFDITNTGELFKAGADVNFNKDSECTGITEYHNGSEGEFKNQDFVVSTIDLENKAVSGRLAGVHITQDNTDERHPTSVTFNATMNTYGEHTWEQVLGHFTVDGRDTATKTYILATFTLYVSKVTTTTSDPTTPTT